jgi:coniferyl-aldehyde dehydrogenase
VERRAALKKLRAAVLARRADFEAALDVDFGHRSRHETAIMEMLALTWGIDYLHKNLRRFMRPERRGVSLPMRFARAHVEYQPRGVVGIVAPWNYPMSLALMPLATAVAAGNRAMIKPSEITPATSEVLGALVRETFSEDEVAVVTGDASTGAAFAALPFDHLFFTGSTGVGRAVMRCRQRVSRARDARTRRQVARAGRAGAAAGARRNRTSPTASWPMRARRAWRRTTRCCTGVMLTDSSKAWGKAVAALYPAGPASPDYSSIVNPHHYERLRGLLDDAQAKGAHVVETGPSPSAHANAPTRFPPTLVLNVNDDMRIMQEEIFGPVLPIVTYGDL